MQKFIIGLLTGIALAVLSLVIIVFSLARLGERKAVERRVRANDEVPLILARHHRCRGLACGGIACWSLDLSIRIFRRNQDLPGGIE